MSAIRLRFKVNPRRRYIAPHDGPAKLLTKKCDWPKIMEMQLKQQYHDMTIQRVSAKGNEITYSVEFKNRPTYPGDVRVRMYEFLRHAPDMKVQELEIAA